MDPRELIGGWRFRREISDRKNDAEYTASGEATFEAESDGRIRWSERGTLRWGAENVPVSRTLFLVPDEITAPLVPDEVTAPLVTAADKTPADAALAAARWRTTFEDGRDFHPWTAGMVEHLCGCDLYRGRLDVPAADGDVDVDETAQPDAAAEASSWILTWRVNGPEKDYTVTTRYTRMR